MSNDFNDMEDYECGKNSKCPRCNIFENMSDEDIKNLFNNEEKKVEKSIEEDWKEILKRYSDLSMHPTSDELIEKYKSADSKTKKEMEKEYPQFFGDVDIRPGWERMNYRNKTPDELIEEVSESNIDHSDYDILDYYKYLKEHHPEFLNLKPFKKNDEPSEFPTPNGGIKVEHLTDIPSGVNYGSCGGIKNDTNKVQLSLVPTQMVVDAALARMYGNNKYKNVPGYSSNNWCTIDKQRVIDAFLRHIVRYLNDEDGVDDESGLPHLCHVAANLAFLCEMQQPNWEEKKKKIIDNDPILRKNKPKE